MTYKNFSKVYDLLFFLRYFPLYFATRNLDLPVKKEVLKRELTQKMYLIKFLEFLKPIFNEYFFFFLWCTCISGRT